SSHVAQHTGRGENTASPGINHCDSTKALTDVSTVLPCDPLRRPPTAIGDAAYPMSKTPAPRNICLHSRRLLLPLAFPVLCAGLLMTATAQTSAPAPVAPASESEPMMLSPF